MCHGVERRVGGLWELRRRRRTTAVAVPWMVLRWRWADVDLSRGLGFKEVG